MKRILGVVLVLVLGNAALAQELRPFVNDRFGVSVQVPSDWQAEPPPANGDGRTFVSRDGTAKLSVYSNFGPVSETANFGEYRFWLMDAEEARYPITYKAAGNGWFVLSGVQGSEIIYMRVIAACDDRSLAHHLRLSYPAAQKKAYDALVGRVASSLRHINDKACPGGEAD